MRDTTLPVYIYHFGEIYDWTEDLNYCDNIVEEVVVLPTCERCWENISGTRVSDHFLQKSYVCKVKQLKDKELSETNIKILNNILPCNRNLSKWGKSDTALCLFCQEEESVTCHTRVCMF